MFGLFFSGLGNSMGETDYDYSEAVIVFTILDGCSQVKVDSHTVVIVFIDLL